MRTSLRGGRILVPLDGSPLAERAVPVAARLAQALGTSVVLATVLPLTTWAFAEPTALVPAEAYQHVLDDERRQAEDYLAPIADRLRDRGITVLTVLDRGEDVASCLIDLLPRYSVGLVVMTTHGRTGLARFALGSVADRLVTGAGIPVLLIRSFGAERASADQLSRALVALDGSEIGESVLPALTELSGAVFHEVMIARVVEPKAASGEIARAAEYLDRVRDHLAQAVGYGCTVSPRVLLGDPAEALIHSAEQDCDIIVLATHGTSGVGRWVLGSVADAVLRGAPTSLLLFHPQESDVGHPSAERHPARSGLTP